MDLHPHPCSLPTRGRDTLPVSCGTLGHGASVWSGFALDWCGSIVSLPLVGRDQGWGAMSVQRARQLRKSMPPSEARLWNALRELKPLGHHFRRQVPLGPYYADFASHRARLVIEVDGDSHHMGQALVRDAARDGFIAAQGYRVLRISNDDVRHNLDDTMAMILNALADTPTLDPSPQGGGRRRADSPANNKGAGEK
ncbi:endonuclease domain-containing protein [Devosia litorisediminis]